MTNTTEAKAKLEIKAYNPIVAAINELTEKYGYIPDCSTSEGLKSVKADYRAVRKYETNLEAKRKELGESARKKLVSINSEAKLIDAQIKEISAPLKLAFEKREKEIEAKVQQRKAALEEKVNAIKAFEDVQGMDSNAISSVIEAVTEIDCFEGFYEYSESAFTVKKQVLESLGKQLNEALIQEQLTIERENLRIEREQQEEQARINELKAKAQERLNNLIMIPSGFFGKSSSEINIKINSLENYEIKESEFGELFNQACTNKKQVIAQLSTMKNQQSLVEQAQLKAEKPPVERVDKEVTPQVHEATKLANQLSEQCITHPNELLTELPSLSDVNYFLSTLSSASLMDFSRLLMSCDEQIEREALSKINYAFAEFLTKDAA